MFVNVDCKACIRNQIEWEKIFIYKPKKKSRNNADSLVILFVISIHFTTFPKKNLLKIRRTYNPLNSSISFLCILRTQKFVQRNKKKENRFLGFVSIKNTK